MMKINSKKTLLFTALFSAMLIWGSSYLIMKDTLSAIEPGFLIFLRSVIAVAFLSFFCIGKTKGIPQKFWLFNIGTGVIVSIAYLVQTVGLKYTTPGKNAFLENVYCIVIPLLIWIIKRKRPTALNFVCMGLCFVGVVIISYESIDGSINVGDVLTALAGVFGITSCIA